MEGLLGFIRFEMYVLLGGYLAAVIYLLSSGKIKLRAIFFETGSRQFRSSRLQVLFFMFFGLIYFFIQLSNDPTKFPNIPPEFVAVMAGSNMIYLGGKSKKRLWEMLSKLSKRILT